MQEAAAIKQIISSYEGASGQKINLDKTEITVSANVTNEKRSELSNSLGVKEVDMHTKYLGLPTLIGRSKRQVFAGIVERVSKKLKDWKEKSHSQAGKEVLIKTVIQALPSYAMNCFLLPITTCQEIEQQAARFFWGSTEEERKCHWANWTRLTTAKTKGGMGFRDLHLFNLAMLAKQLWGIIHNPESLSARMLKAKYFPKDEVLNAKMGFQPSYLWRSLLASRTLVQDGMSWIIGDGEQTSICKDRWIGTDNLEQPQSILNDEWKEAKVKMLIDGNTSQWKREMIENNFNREEARRILAMPRNRAGREDLRVWRLTKQGWFTVRSAYHRAVELFSTAEQGRASSSTPQAGWKQIWKVSAIPRVRLFLWRTCANALPVKTTMLRRGCNVDPICVLCGEEPESLEHLLLYCSQTQITWYASRLRVDLQQKQFVNFRDFLWMSMERYDAQYVSLLAYIAWEIWKRRNAAIFEGKAFHFQEVITKATDNWDAYEQGGETKLMQEQRKNEDHKWEKPPPRQYKMNTDVATWPDGRVGFGFVVRDHDGNVVLAAKTEKFMEGSSTLLEGMAIKYALEEVVKYRLQVHQVECDNSTIVGRINGTAQVDMYSAAVVKDIQQLMGRAGCSTCKYIRRQANQLAHHVAHGRDFLCIHHNPEHVLSVLQTDVLAN